MIQYHGVAIFPTRKKKEETPGVGPLYLLEGAGGPLRQAALHQVVPQLPEVKQLVPVVLHRGRHQLRLQAQREHRLHLHALLALDRRGRHSRR